MNKNNARLKICKQYNLNYGKCVCVSVCVLKNIGRKYTKILRDVISRFRI